MPITGGKQDRVHKSEDISQPQGCLTVTETSQISLFIKIVPYNPYQFHANEKSRDDLDGAEARTIMEVSFILCKEASFCIVLCGI